MALLDSDLLYCNRGGTNYRTTWGAVRNRTVLATDEFLIFRSGTHYKVPIGDFWTCTETSQAGDYFLVERAGAFYYEEILFPCSVRFEISGATTTTIFASAIPDASGEAPYIVQPDGTKVALTATPTAITLTQNGVYEFAGAFTEFKVTGSDGAVDTSLDPVTNWNSVFAGVSDFGNGLFQNISDLSGLPENLPLKSLDRTFEGTSPSATQIGTLDVTEVTSAVGTFLNSQIDPTDDISAWDVSNVTNMSRMFEGASLFDSSVAGWDIANVTDMSSMFKGANNNNQDLSGWGSTIVNVTNMNSMFEGNALFNTDITLWDVANVTDMDKMFSGAASFNQDLGEWDVSNTLSMSEMFKDTSVFDQDLSEWCVNLIPSEPADFSTNSPLGTAGNAPTWGTCPLPECGEMYYIGGSSPLRMAGTASAAGEIVKPDGTTQTIGPGNWTFSTVLQGTYHLPVDVLTKLNFANNPSQQFDFAPCFYTGNINDMSCMFWNCRQFNGDVANWDTANVTNMHGAFNNAIVFNSSLSGWETGNVSNASNIFLNAVRFNQDISSWDVSSVSNAQNFFRNAKEFNQDISSWDFGNNTTFVEMFSNAFVFNGDVSGWNVSKGVNFLRMFYNARAFTGGDLSGWNTTNAESFANMFDNAIVFNSNVTTWDTSNVTNMTKMFYNARAFNQNIDSWDTSQVTNVANMFHNARIFNHSLNNWDMSGVSGSTNMARMFKNAVLMTSDLTEWCVGGVTSEPTEWDRYAGFENDSTVQPRWGDCPIDEPQGMTITNFNGDRLYVGVTFGSGTRAIIQPDGTSINISNGRMTELTQLGRYTLPMGTTTRLFFNGRNSTSSTQAYDVEFEFDANFYTGALTSMYQTFRNAQRFNADLSTWDTSKVTNMRDTFYNSKGFNNDISTWNTSNVTTFNNMFGFTDSFNSDISNWDTSQVTNMSNTFRNAQAFNQDLTAWDTGSATTMFQMFTNAGVFNQTLNPWDVSDVSNMTNMFFGATAMRGNISNWCVSRISSEPSRFDTDAGFDGNDPANAPLLPTWGTCSNYNGIYLKELVGGVGDLVIGGVATDNTVQIIKPDGTVDNIGTGTFANKYTQLGWYEIINMDKLSGLRFFDNDILFDDTSETADFRLSSTIDTSGLTESRQMFREAKVFNGDISMLNLSNVTNMAAMFRNAHAFNQDVTNFPTENVTNMSNMFRGASLINQDFSEWSVYNVTAMDDMFREATAFSSDISDWCVPLIGSAPSDFDTNSGFAGNITAQPQWGTCPNEIAIVTPPAISNTNGTTPAPYGEDVLITTAAVTDPATGVTRIGYRWQRSADGATGWADIPASENNGTSETYQPNGHDRNQYIRLIAEYEYPGVPTAFAESNAVQVENGEPPVAPLYTSTNFQDWALGIQFEEESRYGYQVATFLGTDGYFHSYGLSSDIVAVWSAETGNYVRFYSTNYDAFSVRDDGGTTYMDWRGGIHVLNESKVLFAPGYINHFWVHDYAANTWSMVDSTTVGGGNYAFNGLVYSTVTGLYYSIPNDKFGDIFEVDPIALTATEVYSNASTEWSFGCAAEGPDGKIYMFPNTYPNSTPALIQFDPATGAVVEMTSPIPPTDMWSSGSVRRSYADCRYSPSANSIIACPMQAMNFIKLDFNNMNGTLPTATEIVQTLDTRTAADSSSRGKWHAMAIREDGRFSCLACGRFIHAGQVSVNAIYDPATDTVIEDGIATLGQDSNKAFLHAAMHPGTGRIGSSLAMNTSGTGGTDNKIQRNPMWDTFVPITSYDPLHPTFNRAF